MDDWQKDTIFRLWKQGKPQREIAAVVGVSVVSVNKAIKKMKQPRPVVHGGILKGEIVARNPQAITIDLTTNPTQESIRGDILVLYRQSLAELQTRMAEMSTNEIYTLSMTLLRELNGGNTES